MLSVRDESFLNIGLRDNEIIFFDNCDELLIVFFESFEEIYEVNVEIYLESEEVSEDSGYVNFKENGKSSWGEIYNKVEEILFFFLNILRYVC